MTPVPEDKDTIPLEVSFEGVGRVVSVPEAPGRVELDGINVGAPVALVVL